MAELRIPMTDDRDGRIVLIVQENLILRVEVAETFKEAGFKVFQVENR
jgi:hypothetical protein